MRALSAGYQMHGAKPFEPAELVVFIASLALRNPDGPHVTLS
jgi:DNA-binding response OmpR family regulator